VYKMDILFQQKNEQGRAEDNMASNFTVALVGFAQNEAATFESFFRLAARRPPSYVVQDEVIDAQVLIVNADNQHALHLVEHAELPGRVLLIGNSDGGTGWPLVRKPVKLVGVLGELDVIVGAKPAAPAAAPAVATKSAVAAVASRPQGLDAVMRRPDNSGVQHAPSPQVRRQVDRGFAQTEPFQSAQMPLSPAAVPHRRRSRDTEFPVTRPMTRSDMLKVKPPAPAPARVAPVPAARPGVMGVTDFGGLDELPVAGSAASGRAGSSSDRPSRSAGDSEQRAKAAIPDMPRGEMLLVAESLVEGRILHKRFKKYGLSIDWSREPAQALVMLKAHPYRLVVVDRLSGEIDALQVCRAAKQHKRAHGGPVVIMFAASVGSMDRMKAGLAGSDAYLSRSSAESDLYKVLAQHRLVSLDGFEKTNVGF
jgi:CheY-like chemotaxis protein